MAIQDNERLQEVFIMIGDRLAPVKRFWWYLLALSVILTIPAYFVVKTVFVTSLVAGYDGPEIIYTAVEKQPLAVLEKKIFTLGNNTYSGFVKIKNTNLEWGVAEQKYSVQFKTFGGTTLNQATRAVFILPASEKLIVLPSFNSETKPDEIVFNFEETHFIHKPNFTANFEVERTTLSNTADGLVVSSAFKNLTPFIIKQVNVPVAVYNNRGEIIAVNFTFINEVKSSEARTFQLFWPAQVLGAVRAEINPEINIFDRNIFQTEPGTSPFNSADRPQ